VNVVAFLLILAISPVPSAILPVLIAAPALLSFALLIAALEIFISARCRSTKEANTYLSILMFSAMGIAMWLAFRPPDADLAWSNAVPFLGHQRLLQSAFAGGASSLIQLASAILNTSLLAAATLAATGLVLTATWTRFERDEGVYGG